MNEVLSISTNLNFKSDFIDYNILPGVKKLHLDFLESKNPATSYYRWNYRNDHDYKKLADILEKQEFPRKDMADILWHLNSKYGCSDRIKENIDKFTDPKSLVVVSGQQVGIFGGPLYTFYKAAGVLKLAEKLEEMLSRPVVPMFWMATEDHDYNEANTAHIVNRNGEPLDLFNKPVNGQLGKSMSQITFGEPIVDVVNELEKSLIQSEFTEPLFSLLREFYKPGEKISDAFGKWISSLFCGYGLVLVDPSDTGFKRLAVPIYEKEINRPFDSNVPDESKSDEIIVRDGYHLQVQKFKTGLNLFYSDVKRERILLNPNRDAFVLESSGMAFSRNELIDLLYKEPVRFSSGALLRPIVQSKLLPTVSFLGGPSEISYHAQLLTYYDYFNVIPPVIRPRPSVSLMGKRINTIINRYGIEITDLFTGYHRVVNNVLIKHFPSDLEGKLDHLQMEVLDLLNSVTPELRNFDEGLKKTFSASTKRIDAELNKLKAKIFQAHKKKHSEVTDQIAHAYDSFFPGGTMQERVLPMIYFLNKYSPAFASELYDEICIDSSKHQIISIIPQ